mmetsp:Transcript_36825/g.80482  ORF Transcript_36825/g.80482 Transcript_36825/m.80482 type:complete len:274 (-) Transcript_36825:6-827(-)
MLLHGLPAGSRSLTRPQFARCAHRWRGRKSYSWDAANMSREEAARQIARILTERQDGPMILRMTMASMPEEERRRIGFSYALGEIQQELETIHPGDGNVTVEHLAAWAMGQLEKEMVKASPGTETKVEALGLSDLREEDFPAPPPPSNAQLIALFKRQTVPFVGFGFVDNSMMILAGDVIDSTVGVALAISTMAAAALGNAFSNGLGMILHGAIERASNALGLADPQLTLPQMQLRSVQLVKTSGGVIGILSGCLLGMCPLFFMNSRSSSVQH